MKTFCLFTLSFILGLGVAVGLFSLSAGHIVLHILPEQMPKSKFSLTNAPSQSLRGYIATFSAEVNWISRTAHQPIKVNKPRTIQQGEELDAGNSGMFTVIFPKIARISALPDTSVYFAQTLPVNLVLNQTQGETTVDKLGRTPISIHALDFLLNINNGKSKVTVDSSQQTVTVTAIRGQTTAAYNDATNTSTVISIPQGSVFIFDNGTKTYTSTNLR